VHDLCDSSFAGVPLSKGLFDGRLQQFVVCVTLLFLLAALKLLPVKVRGVLLEVGPLIERLCRVHRCGRARVCDSQETCCPGWHAAESLAL
jgi:hypothetical protein